MPDVTTIHPADLRAIERSLDNVTTLAVAVRQELTQVHGRVATLQENQDAMSRRLVLLAEEFATYVETDARQKQVQLAETRVVKVRQELETRFGHYAEVRNRATGILQALDAGLVSHDTVQHTTEDVMMKAPGYWLAPGLVAIAAWSRGDRALADRAVAEALRRDDYKTSLAFALILRRCDRPQASARWLDRFFAHQDPAALDREFVVLLDGVASGVFGAEGRAVATPHIARWLAELSERPGFVEEQQARWTTALLALTPVVPDSRAPLLHKHSPTWPALRRALQLARLHQRVLAYFEEAFAGEIVPSAQLEDDIDALLDTLVRNFDDEELPLRSQERLLQLIIDADGDRAVAEQRFEAEREAFRETVPFTGLLTNAAMHPELSGASLATQRYAIALSRDWIVRAHDAIAAEARAQVPAQVQIEVDDWRGQSRDGKNGRELLAAMEAHYREQEEIAAAAVKLSTPAMVAPFVGGALLLYGLAQMVSWVALIVGAAALGFWYLERRGLDRRREEARERVRRRHEAAVPVLRAVLAELVDVRAELAAEDGRAAEVRDALLAITPEQHALSRPSQGRTDATP